MNDMIAPPIFEPFITQKARYKIAYGGRGCYPADTEFLTPDGWKRIDEYERGDEVLVYNRDGGGSFFTSDVDYVDLPTDKFVNIKNQKTDFTTSWNHKHLLRNEKTKKLEVLTTETMFGKHNNLVRGVKHKMIRTFVHDGEGIGYSDDFIRLKIAVIADGHFPTDRKFGTCRVNLKKERKIDRLKRLLEINHIPYKLTINAKGFHVFVFRVDNDEKEFESYWYRCNRSQLDVVCDEVVRWDGSILKRGDRVDAIGFSSVSKKTIDFVQFAHHASGFKMDVVVERREDRYKNGLIYTAAISKNHTETSISKDNNAKTTTSMNLVDRGDRMYCFTTPTGYFPVRQKGRIYVSGNSGKSWSIARILIEISRRSNVRILCARELQSSIHDSVIQLLADTIDRSGYTNEFEVLKTEIVHKHTKSRFMFYGIRHNITKIKSIENISICWVEEGENVQADSWQTLIPSVRGKGSEIWVSFNPKNILDDSYQRFIVNPPENSIVIKVNHNHNPYFPDELRQEMEEMKKRDYELYLHVWEGEPVGDSEWAFVRPLHVRASIDAHKKIKGMGTGRFQVGYDVSDEGDDASAFIGARGSVLHQGMLFPKQPQERITRQVFGYAYQNNADLIVYDSIGVGAGAKIVFRQMNAEANSPIKAIGFNAGGKVRFPKGTYMKGTGKRNEDMFANLKAQEWWNVRQRFENTYLAIEEGMIFDPSELISIPSDFNQLDQLVAELSRPQIEYDRNGKIKVESKMDMAKRSVPSPNYADSLIMAFSGQAKGGAGLIC